MASRLRAKSEVIPRPGPIHGPLITDAFQPYHIPHDWQSNADPYKGSRPEPYARYLGIASLQPNSLNTVRAAFYQVIESEISKIALNDAKPDDDETGSPSESCTASEDETLASPDPHADNTILAPISTSEPRFGKKKTREIRRSVIFCLEPPDNVEFLCADRDYYVFPNDAVVEAMNQNEPLEVLFSFHLPTTSRSSPLHDMCSCNSYLPERTRYKTKLEEFAAVCSNSCRLTSGSNNAYPQRRLTDPGVSPAFTPKTDSHIMNMRISNVSKPLYDAVKQTVSVFETAYERMLELVTLHSQQVAYQKAEILLRTNIYLEQGDSNTEMNDAWHSSDDNYWEKDLPDLNTNLHVSDRSPDSPPPTTSTSINLSTNTTMVPFSPSDSKHARLNANGTMKKCLYCGSKTTPMWRRGPQGAGTLCNACGVKWKHGKILCGTNANTIPTSAESGQPQLIKGEKKRKRSMSLAGKKEKPKVKRLVYGMDDQNDLVNAQSRMTIARHGSTSHRQITPSVQSTSAFAIPTQRESDVRVIDIGYDGSLSRSMSNSFSSLGSPSSSSPPPSYQHKRRHTTDTSIIEKMGLNNTSFPMSAGVDAVEAAAVLTLLKRS